MRFVVVGVTGNKMYNLKDISAIKEFMLKHRQTLSVAESETSGHLQAAFSLADGATEFFQGGITAYNLGQKSRHLKVEPIHATSANCVSEKVAEQMAIQVLDLFSSDWAIAITGYAAPVPELGVDELYAFYCVAYQGKVVESKKITAKSEELYDVQVHYANTVLSAFNKYLKKESNNSVRTGV